MVTVTDAVNEDLDSKQLHQRLQEGIAQLPPKCKAVFLLSREDHLSHKEIAERLHISINTVDQHIQKALRLLRETVNEYKHSIISVIMFCFVFERYFML